MTISSTANRNSYTGNDTTATYSYTYRIFLEGDLSVTVRNTADDVETTLVLNTDYTVTGVSDASGGTIVLAGTGKAWQGTGSFLNTGYILVIRRVVQLTQGTDIRNQGDFFPEVHEDFFDKAIMVDQQQQDALDRSIKLSETIDPTTFDTNIPSAVVGASNLSLVVNATGDGFAVGPTVADITGANASAIAAAASETAAGLSETAAALSETNAGVSETNAAASETAAGLSETAAAASAAAALVSEGNASTSETNAGASETAAAASAAAALVSEGNAATSETNAAASEAAAALSAAAISRLVVATETISAAGDIAHSDDSYQYRRVQGNATAVTTSTTPFGTVTTNFVDGMEILLVGVDNTNTVTIPFNDAASGALLNGSATLSQGDCLSLIYDATLLRFIERSRNF